MAKFEETNLAMADLTGIDARRAYFAKANLSSTLLQDARLRCTTFDEAELSGTILNGADIRNSRFERAKTPSALFVNSRLNFTDFSHADISGADFTSANLFMATLHNTREEGTKWHGALLAAVRRTDLDRLEAEAWQPPPRKK